MRDRISSGFGRLDASSRLPTMMTAMPFLRSTGALALALSFAVVPGHTTWAAANKARWRLATFRVGDGWPAAERALELTPAAGTLLAPRRVND